MSTLWPIALWYGGLLAIVAAALLGLWALALIALKQATDFFASALLIAVIVLSVGSGWAVMRATGLNQIFQLQRVHEPLMRLVADSIQSRRTLEDVLTAAEPSAELTALQSKYDAHATSIENLLQAEWQYHRAGPWDERGLLYKMTWDVTDLFAHHARWDKRAEALDCPAPPPPKALPDAVEALKERFQSERLLAGAVGGQIEGFDISQPQAQRVSDATIVTAMAGVCGVLALLIAAAVLVAWRKRSWSAIDVVAAVTAVVLVNLAGWLALGAGSDQERLRENLFYKAAAVYGETLELTKSLDALMPLPRNEIRAPRETKEKLIADHAEFMNSLTSLVQLVRTWDRDVLTGTLDTRLIASEQIRTRDDLLNAVRARTLTLFRQSVQLERGIADLSCRSEWFPRERDITREQRLVGLPTSR
jgi:hypothetical protein